MGYGNSYPSEKELQVAKEFREEEAKEKKSQQESFVEKFCKRLGYNRESFKDMELEIKLNLSRPRPALFYGNQDLYLGEELSFPSPYCLDKILPTSQATHNCYAFVDTRKRTLESAFTEVDDITRIKLKCKSETQIYEKSGIYLLKRKEQHIPIKSNSEMIVSISSLVKNNKLPVEFIGGFEKRAKECFIFNPTSGRIFVISTGICQRVTHKKDILDQLEIEYYGQVNSYNSKINVSDEMISLASKILNGLPSGYSAKPTTLTKIGWLASKDSRFNDYRMIGEK